MWRVLPLVLALAAPPAWAASPRSFSAVVTHVTDGDTVWVRPATGGRALQLRLTGLDAPEICQPGGEAARDALAQRLLHQPVQVHAQGRDDWDRTLARVDWAGQDVGAWLVFNGLAWSYRYRRDPGPYQALQAQARQARRGLWSEPGAMEPRRFRRAHGSCQPAAR